MGEASSKFSLFFKFMATSGFIIMLGLAGFFAKELYSMSKSNSVAVLEQRVFQEGLNVSLAATIDQIIELKSGMGERYRASDAERDSEIKERRDILQDKSIEANFLRIDSNSTRIVFMEKQLAKRGFWMGNLESAILTLQHNQKPLFEKNQIPVPKEVTFPDFDGN